MASAEEEPRNCVVCGDRATGYHFHALTCEGCKGFFRRTASKSIVRTCSFAGSCEVSKAQRRHCPACRLQKCLSAGMKKDMILSAEALALRRAKQAQQRAERAPPQLSEEQKELVQILLEAHTRHVGTMFDQFVQFRPPAHLFIHYQPLSTLAPVLPLLKHFADISTFMVQQVIKFTKDLPIFRSLPVEDQISLLKGAALEICHIALNTTFCVQTRNFLCGPLRYTIDDGAHVGFQGEFLDLLLRFHGNLRRLELQEPAYVLLAAVALFSPGEHPRPQQKLLLQHLSPKPQPLNLPSGPTHLRPRRHCTASPAHTCLPILAPYLADRLGLTHREEIDQLQEVLALTLQNYIQGQQPRPRDRFLYAKLLGLLTELRSINSAYGYQIRHIQGLSAMMPLLQEIYS